MKTSEASLELLTSVFRRLRAKNWTKDSVEQSLYVYVSTDDCVFDINAIHAVERTFKPLGWFCRLNKYDVNIDERTLKPRKYNYIWELTKNN